MLMNAPGYVFSLPALVFLLAGVATMGISLTGATLGAVTFGTHTMILGSLLTIVGYEVGSLGLFSSIANNSIRRPQDAVTNWIRENVELEYGVSAGVVAFGLGAAYFGLVLTRWFESGIIGFQYIVWNMLAFTLIVLGVQTVFFSFFMSMLGQRRRRL